MKNDAEKRGKGFFGMRSTAGKITIIVVGILIGLLAGFVIGLKIYYSSHWYPNTWIGDREVSNMKCDESADLMDQVYDSYQLEILGRNDSSQIITKADIDYKAEYRNSVIEQFDKQHESFPLFSLGDKKQVELQLNVSYDKKKLERLLGNAEIVKGSSSFPIERPKNAKVVFSNGKGFLEVRAEEKGNTIVFQKLCEAVESVLDSGYEKLNLTDENAYPDMYEKPEITSDDAELNREVDVCNAAVLRWMTWKIDSGVKETVGPKKIYSWCTYNNGQVSFKRMPIRNWVEKLCLRYKTVGMTRTFKNHLGKKVSVSGGDYGWAFEYESMVEQLMKFLEKKIKPEKQEAYIKNQGKKEKKALTVVKKPKYANTAFKYDYDNKENDWDTDNFTEISLSEQMVYVWRKGKVAYSCPTISGRPVPERETRKGAYYIKEHQTHRVLKGDDYETPVDWWVRIMWTGTGFHSAPWQSWSSWSSTYYQTRGSHGCLNLSPTDALKIYNITKFREMVFIY